MIKRNDCIKYSCWKQRQIESSRVRKRCDAWARCRSAPELELNHVSRHRAKLVERMAELKMCRGCSLSRVSVASSICAERVSFRDDTDCLMFKISIQIILSEMVLRVVGGHIVLENGYHDPLSVLSLIEDETAGAVEDFVVHLLRMSW